MITRRALLASTAVIAATPVLADAVVRVGAPAPAFAVKDSDGKLITLDSLKGKAIVLEWTNPECPYVAKHYVSGNMQALQAEAAGKGAVWLTISSAGPGQFGYLDELEAAALIDKRQARPAHFLLDYNGRMLADYAVPVALTLAVIAPDGRLAYHGAIDDKPNARAEDVATAHNYVRAALTAVSKGELPSPAQTRPYGCALR